VIDNSNGCAAPSSNAVTVIVRPDATITAVVNNAEVCIGGAAQLTATLTGGSGSATLQWQSASNALGPWTNIAGATQTIFNAPTRSAGDFFSYVLMQRFQRLWTMLKSVLVVQLFSLLRSQVAQQLRHCNGSPVRVKAAHGQIFPVQQITHSQLRQLLPDHSTMQYG
jgi:hypothetical protein